MFSPYLVLLALAAIAIVWSFLSPTFTDTGEQINVNSKCLQAEMKPTACVVFGSNNASANITVQTIRGEAVNMILIVEDGDGAREVGSVIGGPQQALESLTVTVTGLDTPLDDTKGAFKALVAPVIVDSGGDNANCAESPTVVTCTFV